MAAIRSPHPNFTMQVAGGLLILGYYDACSIQLHIPVMIVDCLYPSKRFMDECFKLKSVQEILGNVFKSRHKQVRGATRTERIRNVRLVFPQK